MAEDRRTDVAAPESPGHTRDLLVEPGAEEAIDRQIVWVLHMHPGLTRRQAHGIVEVDFENGVARCLCGLELQPYEIGDVPSDGCQVCECCIAETR